MTTIAQVEASGDGSYPQSGLVDTGGLLYGTVPLGGGYGYGAVYSVNRTTGVEKVVYSFKGGATDGGQPLGALIKVGGALYGTTGEGGAASLGTVFKFDPATGGETVVYMFQGGADGGYPVTALSETGGILYGTTYGNKVVGPGTIFSVDPATGQETVLHGFTGNDGENPDGPLLIKDGALYGTTLNGGAGNEGVVFKFDIATGMLHMLHSFQGTDGYNPMGALVATNGRLIGTTFGNLSGGCGEVFSVNVTTGVEKVAHIFNCTEGSHPLAGVIAAGGQLYGTVSGGAANGCGGVFTTDASTGATTVIASLDCGAEGSYPQSGLTSVQGMLYGTAGLAGTYRQGTVFGLNPSGDGITPLHSFTGVLTNSGAQGLLGLNGSLYLTNSIGGTFSSGAVVKIDPSSGAETVLHSFTGGADGGSPHAALLDYKGKLYGTTYYGGASAVGTVFRIDPVSGTEQLVYAFAGGNDGAVPQGSLIGLNGILYGTTVGGGTNGYGTVFSVNPATGIETVLYSFAGSPNDGGNPAAGLVNINGVLYGTAAGGGSFAGTVFKFDPSTGIESILHAFTDGADGSDPAAPLVDLGGKLYGSTLRGSGAAKHGTVFSIDPGTGALTTICRFSKGGMDPGTALLPIGKSLYGTTLFGGHYNGTLFKLTLKPDGTAMQTVLYEFSGGSNGGVPSAALVKVNGTFYGATVEGGAAGLGTVFDLVP